MWWFCARVEYQLHRYLRSYSHLLSYRRSHCRLQKVSRCRYPHYPAHLFRPRSFQWNLPAGYAEIEERPSDTARREVQEESGPDVQIGALVGVYYFDDDPRGNGILTVYSARIIGGVLTKTSEGLEPTCFAPEELPRDLAGAGHDQAILDWRDRISGVSVG
jgi:ADP-ribose pyrophosphatase YjhB (NUDIX family)